jgi:hypothetical protein
MQIPAIRFKQWLKEWDQYDYEISAHRRRPEPHIYLFSMKAADLRRISDVYRRRRDGDVAEGIQRRRDETRISAERLRALRLGNSHRGKVRIVRDRFKALETRD